MSNLITDEMVETAAHAAFRDGFMRHAPEHENRDLSDYDDGIRESWRVVARAALEAVAPMIAGAALQSVRDALANHPRCEEHPDGGVITCGWKTAVLDVRRALEARNG